MSDSQDPEGPPMSFDPASSSEVGSVDHDPHGKNGEAGETNCADNVRDSSSGMNDDKWLQILDQQNRNFQLLLQAMKLPTSSSAASVSEVHFPKFDPGKDDIDARAWINTADLCVTDENCQGPALMIALSRALKGEASTWLSTVSFHGMTWCEFKDLFITRYDCPETCASFLINLSGKKPKENECLAAFAATLMTSILSKWKGLTVEEIAVATVLAHVAKFEPSIQRLSFTTNIKTHNQLQKELKAVSFLKRHMPSSSEKDGPDTKISRFTSTTV